VIVRETNAAAWKAADELIQYVTDETWPRRKRSLLAWTRSASSAWRNCMVDAATGSRSARTYGPVSVWCAGGAGTALVGDPPTVAARIREYQDVGIDTFIMSGYPHLEEAYRFAEFVFRLLSLQQSDNVAQLRVNTGPFGETIANEHRPLVKASQFMSLIESLPRIRSLRLPRADGLIQWIVPLVIVIIWQVACVSDGCQRGCCGAERCRACRLEACCCRANSRATFGSASGGPASVLSLAGGIGFAFGLMNGLSQLRTSSPTPRFRWCETFRIWR